MKKTGLIETVKVFSVDDNAVDTNEILDIRRYLMKKASCLGKLRKYFLDY